MCIIEENTEKVPVQYANAFKRWRIDSSTGNCTCSFYWLKEKDVNIKHRISIIDNAMMKNLLSKEDSRLYHMPRRCNCYSQPHCNLVQSILWGIQPPVNRKKHQQNVSIKENNSLSQDSGVSTCRKLKGS